VPILRRSAPLLLAGLLAGVPGLHATGRVVAFGDSITDGATFDDPARPEPGYPLRLEEMLPLYGLTVEVDNRGRGGEDTTEGITRIDAVLEAGDGMLLLMEGTNDISREISAETTLFNLDAMAQKAEALGIVAVHATLIPRIPTAKVDADNKLNRSLAQQIRALASAAGRPLVDPFAEFSTVPGVFDQLYTKRDGDPVGHPNAAGFELLAELFLPVVLEDYPRIDVEIAFADEVIAGQRVAFAAVIDGEAASTRWSFGDGGFAWSGPSSDFGAEYFFTEPGTYEVRVEVVDRFGRVFATSETVEVEAGTVDTVDQQAIVQAVTSGGVDGVTGCTFLNTGGDLALVELSYVPRGNAGVPPRRKLALAPQEPVVVDDLLAELFELAAGEGSIHVRQRALAAAPQVDVVCRTAVELEEPAGGVFGHLVEDEPETSWSAAPKVLSGLLQGGSLTSTLRAVNLDEAAGTITVELFDAAGASLGSPVAAFKLGARAMRQRKLTEVFPQAKKASGPFAVRATSSGVRFALSATVTETRSHDTVFVPAIAPRDDRTLYVPRVVRGQGWPRIEQRTQLLVTNPSTVPTQLDLDFFVRGSKASGARRARVALELGPGETRVWSDVLAELFDRDEATGSLRVGWSNQNGVAPQVRAFVFTSTSTLRFVHLVDAVGAAALRPDLAAVFGAEQSSSEKSNLGLLNLGSGRTGVQLRLRAPGGLAVATARLSLASLQHYERNLSAIFPGIGKGSGWLVEVDVLQGGPVLPYLLRSNVTGDAFLLPFHAVD
jgi:lysophospholipase L1-like esterase